jgi:hypothetical protein
MPCRILGRVLPLAVLEIRRLHQDARAVLPGALAVRARVIDPHHDEVRHLSGARRLLVMADVGHDDGTVAKSHLRAVALADLEALLEPERLCEPLDCLPDVRVDQDGDHDGRRDRTVRLHRTDSPPPSQRWVRFGVAGIGISSVDDGRLSSKPE